MAQTTNFAWILPTVGGHATEWGDILNEAFEAVDQDLKDHLPRAAGAANGLTGPLLCLTPAAGAGGYASLRLPHGAAPTTNLANGDLWSETGGVFAQVNGATVRFVTAAAAGGAVTLSGALAVAGAASFDGAVTLGNAAGDAITVTGAPTFGAAAAFSAGLTTTTVTASGTATFNGDTAIGNAAGDGLTIAPASVTWSNNPTHSGNHSFSGNVTVNGNTVVGNAAGDALTVAPASVTWSNNPTHSGNHAFSGAVTVSGATTLNGTVNLGNAAGDTITAVGAADFQNNVTLGSSAADLITVNGTVAGIPGVPFASGRANLSGGSITGGPSNGCFVTRDGQGLYTVTFDTPTAAAADSLIVQVSVSRSPSQTAEINYHSVTQNGFEITVQNSGGSSQLDPDSFSWSVSL